MVTYGSGTLRGVLSKNWCSVGEFMDTRRYGESGTSNKIGRRTYFEILSADFLVLAQERVRPLRLNSGYAKTRSGRRSTRPEGINELVNHFYTLVTDV